MFRNSAVWSVMASLEVLSFTVQTKYWTLPSESRTGEHEAVRESGVPSYLFQCVSKCLGRIPAEIRLNSPSHLSISSGKSRICRKFRPRMPSDDMPVKPAAAWFQRTTRPSKSTERMTESTASITASDKSASGFPTNPHHRNYILFANTEC